MNRNIKGGFFNIEWRDNAMKCPICSTEMVAGDVVCKTAAGPTLYPRKAEETELKHFGKMFFEVRTQ